eukprot:m.3397 g.3397  ORF g.3397 m.3397 type:complete len:608 (+) comp9346_c0_seq1:1-1824(+)
MEEDQDAIPDADCLRLVESGKARGRKATFSRQFFSKHWRYFILFLTPLLFSPLLIAIETKPARAGYVVCLMAVYWMTEACPIAATALLPIILFPLLGVMSSTQTCMNYLKDGNALFLAGLMIAVAFEKWDLHKRIALRVLLIVGTKPKWLLFGFMCTTAFLSMWISNTATVAMMLPIALAVLSELEEEKRVSDGGPEEAKNQHLHMHMSHIDGNRKSSDTDMVDERNGDYGATSVLKPEDGSGKSNRFTNMSKALMLGLAYAANLGGTATLTGTGPNLVLRGDIDSKFPQSHGIGFGDWFLMAFPNMVVLLLISWLWLCFMFLTKKCCCRNKRGIFNLLPEENAAGAKAIIQQQYKSLGPIKFAEIAVLVDFIILAILWLTRSPVWTNWFPKDDHCQSFATDTTAGMLMCFLLFIFPARLQPAAGQSSPRLLDWTSVQKNLPWGIVILMGGGFALADGCQESGLSEWIGQQLSNLSFLPPSVLAFFVMLTVAMVTEVSSNVATTTLFLPILADLAVGLAINPLYLMISATLAASFAFMLPVATPPNAMVFSSGRLRVIDMVLAGLVMNFASIAVTMLTLNTIGQAVFDLHHFPEWANQSIFPNGSSC